jgi:hypothetical protein
VWQTVQPMVTAVWTYFPVAFSLWHSRHLGASTFAGSGREFWCRSARKGEAENNRKRASKRLAKSRGAHPVDFPRALTVFQHVRLIKAVTVLGPLLLGHCKACSLLNAIR